MKIFRLIDLSLIMFALTACASQVPVTVPLTSTSTPFPPTVTQTLSPTLTPTSTLTPTITPTLTPTPLGNSEKLYYSACSLKSCTGIYSIDLNNYQLTPITTSSDLVNISPDGRRMIMNQDGQTYVASLDGENKTTLPKANRFSILWLPDNQHIAYIIYGDSKKNERYIYISNWDGSDSKKITKDDDKPFSLIGVTTKGNETILYYGMADTSTSLIKPLGVKWVNVDTGLEGHVSQERLKSESINCSVYKNHMACTGGNWYLYLINIDNSNRIVLLQPEDYSKNPPGTIRREMFWTRDGRELIVSAYLCKPKCNKSMVYAFSSDNGKLLRQSSEIDGLLFLAGVSPDGKLALLFGNQNDRFDSKPSLNILNLDDFTVTNLNELALPVPSGIWQGTIQWLPIVIP